MYKRQVNLPDASAHGLAVARTTGANKTGVAEMALMMMLAAGRQVMLNRKTVASGVWEKNIGHESVSYTHLDVYKRQAPPLPSLMDPKHR